MSKRLRRYSYAKFHAWKIGRCAAQSAVNAGKSRIGGCHSRFILRPGPPICRIWGIRPLLQRARQSFRSVSRDCQETSAPSRWNRCNQTAQPSCKTLDEEKAADHKLTRLTEGGNQSDGRKLTVPAVLIQTVNEAKSRAVRLSLAGDQDRRSANFAPQNDITAPRPRAARPASTPDSVGIALGAAAVWPAAASMMTPTTTRNCRSRSEI